MDEEDQSLATWLRGMRFLGVAPYRSLRLLQTSRPLALYSRVLFFCYGAVMALILISDRHKISRSIENWGATVYWSMLSVSLVCILIVLYLGIFHSPRRMRRTFYYWKHIKKINQSVGRVATADPAQRQARTLLVGVQLAMFLLNAADIYSTSRSDDSSIQETFGSRDLNIPITEINHTIDMLGMVGRRTADGAVTDKKLVIKKLRALASAYVSTCELVRQHNSSEEILLLMLLFSIAVNLATSVYIIVTKGLQQNDLFTMVTEVLWYILDIVRGMVMATPCHKMDDEVRRIRNLICKLMSKVRDTEDHVLGELEVFHIHLSANQPSYTILGMFTLNRPLVITMTAFVTTGLAFFE